MKEFFSLLWAKFSARRRGIVNPKPLFDREKVEELLRTSPVPGVTTLVLVWAVSSTLIIISMRQQMDISGWMIGQKAPINIHARTDFSYIDGKATREARENAASETPEFFLLDKRKSGQILKNFDDFFRFCDMHLAAVEKNRLFIPPAGALPAIEAGKLSPQLLKSICREKSSGNFAAFRDRLQRLIQYGIIAKADKENRTAGRHVRLVDEYGRARLETRTIGEMPDPELAAIGLADKFFPRDNSVNNRAFREIAAVLIGRGGNLNFDAARSRNAKERSAASVKEIRRFKNKGALLIRKGETFTEDLRNMMLAEHAALPKDFGMNIFYYNMAWCLILLLTAAFVTAQIYPKVLTDARKICIAGAVIIISLLINYWSIKIFFYCLREGRVPDREMIYNAIPIALSSVLIAALLNYRLAVVAGFFTAAVTALMVSPAQGFELTFRWFAVAAVSGLLVRNVSNYRAYFIRIFFSSFALTLLINVYYLFQNREIWLKLAPDMLMISAATAFACAVAAQVLIFIMELVYNIDTDMALMVLADYNHPLLERLKREAPGTMFHSMTVATLAEDAANAIGANPLRAKVAGLYHDIGKLAFPQYFTENNRDSSAEHLKLNPQLSSIIIRDHVKEGLILARKYRLFRWIRGAITTHHGDDLVHYFYARAKSVSSDAVVESQFRYNGQPPRSKELTILSLADACEAASRSLDKPTPQKIQALVEDIFIHRCTGGQLRSSELTLAEFEQVKKSFITTLVSIHHGRIAYTPENMNEKSSLQLEKQ